MSEINYHRHTLLTLLDFSAAFEAIDQQMLLEHLSLNFNISSVALEESQSYLANEQQTVYVGQP